MLFTLRCTSAEKRLQPGTQRFGTGAHRFCADVNTVGHRLGPLLFMLHLAQHEMQGRRSERLRVAGDCTGIEQTGVGSFGAEAKGDTARHHLGSIWYRNQTFTNSQPGSHRVTELLRG